MNRTLRILVAATALVLLVVASTQAAPSERARDRMAPVAASHQPASPGNGAEEPQNDDEHEADGTPSQQLLDRLVAKLEAAGVSTDAEAIAALAAEYGVGGAVRILAWAEAAGMGPGEITDLFDSGLGWGEIAQQLNEADATLDLHPGIGRIMSNGAGQGQGQGLGLGRANAPGQQNHQ